jgi:hypothetical protein
MSRNKDEAMITTVETTLKVCKSRNKDEAMITTVENSGYHCFIFVP